MSEGHFGTDQYYVDRLKQRKNSLATNLMWRELGVDPYGVRKRANQYISQVSSVTRRMDAFQLPFWLTLGSCSIN